MTHLHFPPSLWWPSEFCGVKDSQQTAASVHFIVFSSNSHETTWRRRCQAMLSDNSVRYNRDKSRGIPRSGKGLLQGIVYCGEYGHKMSVHYKTGAKHLCHYLRRHCDAPVCQNIPADRIDDYVVQLFFKTFSSVELDLLLG
jgi:hypothetical protein